MEKAFFPMLQMPAVVVAVEAQTSFLTGVVYSQALLGQIFYDYFVRETVTIVSTAG